MTTFFISLLMWLGCAIAFCIFRFKVQRQNREVIYAYIRPSIRQGFLIAATIAGLLVLQLFRVVSWWDIILIVLVAILFEIAFRQNPTRKTFHD